MMTDRCLVEGGDLLIPQADVAGSTLVTVWASKTVVTASPGHDVQVAATCPTGMVALGGGGHAGDPTVGPGKAALDVSRPHPYDSPNPTGWLVGASRTAEAGTGQLFVVASVICSGEAAEAEN